MTSQEYINTGFVLCLICLGVNRYLGEQNLTKLNSEEKSLLVDEFRTLRLYPSLITIGLLIGVLLFAKSFKEHAREVMIVVMVVMAALIGGTLVLARSKINRLPINAEYKKMYLFQQSITLVGIMVGFGFLMFGMMTK